MADTEYYEVNPSDTTQIWRTDTLGQLYRAGGVNVHTRFAGVLAALGTEPPVQSHIYHRTAASNPAPEPAQYYRRADNSPSTVFEGSVNSPTARVVETTVWERISITELRDEKLKDLERKVLEVLDQGVVVSGVGDLRSTQRWRNYYLGIQNNTLPDATVYRTPDLWGQWLGLQKGQCPSVNTSLSTFLDAPTLSQAEVHEDEVHRLYTADDWDALAAYDPTTGFPAAPTPPTQQEIDASNGGRGFAFAGGRGE